MDTMAAAEGAGNSNNSCKGSGIRSNGCDEADPSSRSHDRRHDQHHHHQHQRLRPVELFAKDGAEAACGGCGGDDESTFALSLLRSACDGCWRKKSKCTGEMPCSRCQRAGVQCTYSTKRKLGRPKGASKLQPQGGAISGTKRKSNNSVGSNAASTSTVIVKFDRPSFAASPATGLCGLPESRFLSCFLEHFTPMCPVADEVSIRDGLMHSFAGMWYGGPNALRGQEALRGRALECAFFSSVAIGGLLSGCPPVMISSHVATAKASVAEFKGLADKHAVSALILHGMVQILLPMPGSNADGRKSLDEAQAIFDSLPEKDPLVSVILAFRDQVDCLSHLEADAFRPPASPPSPLSRLALGPGTPLFSTPVPVKATKGTPTPYSSGGGAAATSGAAESHPASCKARTHHQQRRNRQQQKQHQQHTRTVTPHDAVLSCSMTAHTEEGEAILKGVEIGRGENQCTPGQQHAHPAYVVADALLLGVRFTHEQGAGGGGTKLRHVHDFIASELNRLVPARAGAMVLISLSGTLLGIKTQLQLPDGMLPAAELIASMFYKCPGWGRSYGRHAAHLALSAFRLYGRFEAYNTLRDIIGTSADEFIANVSGHDDVVKGCAGHVCGLDACTTLAESMLRLKVPNVASRGGSNSSKENKSSSSSNNSNDTTAASSVSGGGATKRQKLVPKQGSAQAQQERLAAAAAAAAAAGSSPTRAPASRVKRERASSLSPLSQARLLTARAAASSLPVSPSRATIAADAARAADAIAMSAAAAAAAVAATSITSTPSKVHVGSSEETPTSSGTASSRYKSSRIRLRPDEIPMEEMHTVSEPTYAASTRAGAELGVRPWQSQTSSWDDAAQGHHGRGRGTFAGGMSGNIKGGGMSGGDPLRNSNDNGNGTEYQVLRRETPESPRLLPNEMDDGVLGGPDAQFGGGYRPALSKAPRALGHELQHRQLEQMVIGNGNDGEIECKSPHAVCNDSRRRNRHNSIDSGAGFSSRSDLSSEVAAAAAASWQLPDIPSLASPAAEAVGFRGDDTAGADVGSLHMSEDLSWQTSGGAGTAGDDAVDAHREYTRDHVAPSSWPAGVGRGGSGSLRTIDPLRPPQRTSSSCFQAQQDHRRGQQGHRRRQAQHRKYDGRGGGGGNAAAGRTQWHISQTCGTGVGKVGGGAGEEDERSWGGARAGGGAGDWRGPATQCDSYSALTSGAGGVGIVHSSSGTGSDFDFVSELGMLLAEDDFSNGAGDQHRVDPGMSNDLVGMV